MVELKHTPNLDKEKLVNQIKNNFVHLDQYKYFRTIPEFTDNNGKFIGDAFFECTFKLMGDKAPVIYEVTGPYDVISKTYPSSARVFHDGNLIYQFDPREGIRQRTAALTWAYIDALKHKPENILFYGPGKVNLITLEYLKHFIHGLTIVDYHHHESAKIEFENHAKVLGVKANYVEKPDLSKYDTIIMAKNSGNYILRPDDINKIQKGAVVISLSTTGTADIAPEAYGANVNVFLDYERTKKFFSDISEADEKGYIKNEIYFAEVLKKEKQFDKENKVNIVRLTGTPIQNIAMIEMVLEMEGIVI